MVERKELDAAVNCAPVSWCSATAGQRTHGIRTRSQTRGIDLPQLATRLAKTQNGRTHQE